MKNLPKYIDLVFCLIVLPVMVMMFPIERWFHHFRVYMLSLGFWLYLLYFLNRAITVPFLFKGERKRIMGFVLIVVSLIVTYIFSSVTLYTVPYNSLDDGIVKLFPTVKQYQQAVWSLFMIVEAFSFAVGMLIQMELQRSKRRAVEAQRDRAEIDLYRAQIKPHFMFNTLNSLYGLFLIKNENALPSLEKFIQMMRYIHTGAGKEYVSLEEEADYIRQHVDLQSLRLNEMTTVSLNVDIEDKARKIPPMLLITFVENCFKHGVSPVEKSHIEISLIERDGILRLNTSNHIFPVTRVGERQGIENCRRRLGLIYPKRHRLDISDSDNNYRVDLLINFSE